jgi:3-dehydroquinate dehydratase-2
MKIAIINGPNLNLLGKREPEIYGKLNFDDYFVQLKKKYPTLKLVYFQSNHEGEIIDKLHEIGFDYKGIILNAGAYTHTSIAIGDAIAAIQTPVVEVHLSNLAQRETYRHHSFMTKNCVGCITGFGLQSYELALDFFLKSIPEKAIKNPE